MQKNLSKAKKIEEIDIREVLRSRYPTQYQEAVLFQRTFQESNQCKLFRVAWDIPADGFKDYQTYQVWYKNLIEETNTYYKSEKNKIRQKKLVDKRKEWAEGKITQPDLRWIEFRSIFAIPLSKFTYDIDMTTIQSGKPIYWRDYIEQCLLFEKPNYAFPTRPLLNPKLKWDSDHQFYELVIENIFSDTTTKDFDNPRFTEKLKELQKKLPGYRKQKPRVKKNFDFGLQVMDLDKENPNLSDFEKAEYIVGEDLAQRVDGIEEKNIKDRIRQTRLRMGRYLKGNSDSKGRS